MSQPGKEEGIAGEQHGGDNLPLEQAALRGEIEILEEDWLKRSGCGGSSACSLGRGACPAAAGAGVTRTVSVSTQNVAPLSR